MSYRKQYFEWDIKENEVLTGIPVGFEVEFAQNPRFYPVLYKISTFEEVTGEIQGTFFYSLDNGETWTNYPVGEAGMAFSVPYKIRLVVNVTETGYLYALTSSIIYKITGDGRSIVDSYEVEGVVLNDIDIQEKEDVLCLIGENKTMYRIFSGESIEPYSNSINLNDNPLSIAVDSYRKSFWEIGVNTVCLKNMHGETVFCLENPLSPIDVDYSSSSSSESSSSSSSSSSSYGYSTSSSSSFDTIYVSGFSVPGTDGTYTQYSTYFGFPVYGNENDFIIYFDIWPMKWVIADYSAYPTISYAYETYDIGDTYYPPNSGWQVYGGLPVGIGTVTQTP